MDNLFGSLYYFPIPKSYLDKNLIIYMFIKDEQEASASSMPDQQIGYSTKTNDGRFRLNELLVKILFEIGHPVQSIPVALLSNNAVRAVGGSKAEIALEVSCHP
jgi:hypothetical protein